MSIGSPPPACIVSEQSVLGAIFNNPDALDRVRDILEPADFAEGVHSQIYEVLCSRRDAGDSINPKIMHAVLGDIDLGGQRVGEYLVRLVREATTVTEAPGHARIIKHAAQMRRLLETSVHCTNTMMAGSIVDPSDYAASMIEVLDEVATSGLSDGMRRVTIGEATGNVIERMMDARAGRVIVGAPYGIPALDRATMGMRAGQLIILAGRPGMGKTAVAVHTAIAVAKTGQAVGFISLEMNAEELGERVLAALAWNQRERDVIPYREIARASNLTPAAIERLEKAADDCAELSILIEQQPGLTIAQIAARARQMKMRAERQGFPLGVLIVDHIGLVKASTRYAGNRVHEVTEITGALKGLAKELGIPVLALSQLNREVEKRDDKRPLLADLRDSGSIEQDADVVLGLFREEYYLARIPDPSDDDVTRLAQRENIMEIEILKQRSGPTARIETYCNVGCNVIAEGKL